MKTDKNGIPYFIIKPTFEAISKLQSLSNCSFEGLNGVPVTNKLSIAENVIKLEFQSSYNGDLDKYWFSNLPEYNIVCDGQKYQVPRGLSHFEGNLTIGTEEIQQHSIFINEITQGPQNDGKPHYWRYVYPIDGGEWFHKINTMPYKDDYNSCSFYALLHPIVGGHQMYLFEKRTSNNQYYMVIECAECITSDEMNHLAMCLTTSMGIVTGKLYGNHRYALMSNDSEFNAIDGISVIRLRKTKRCPYRIFDTKRTNVQEMLSNYDYQKYAMDEIVPEGDCISWFYDEDPIKNDVFANLSNLCFHDNDMLLAASMLLEGSLINLEYQRPFYHVALETITSSVFVKDKIQSTAPMENKEYQEKVLPSLLDTLKNIADLPEAARQIFTKRLTNNLNTAANQDKLEAPFLLFGYTPTREDMEAIKHRNKSFHGHLSIKAKSLFEQRDEFFAMSLRIHKLCCILLFKAAGFSGKILNNEVLFGIKDACDRKEHAYIEI